MSNARKSSRIKDEARLPYEQARRNTSKKLAEKYKLEEAAQLRLLKELSFTEATVLSGANLTKENWNIPSDLTPWKETRAELANLAKSLWAASKIADKILDEGRTAFWALERASQSFPYDSPNLVVIRELAEIAGKAASFKGTSGNRPHPQWMLQATKQCMDFWRVQKGSEPTAYFKRVVSKPKNREEKILSRGTTPGNEFSEWFCAVMKAVGGLNESQCATLLGRIRAPLAKSKF